MKIKNALVLSFSLLTTGAEATTCVSLIAQGLSDVILGRGIRTGPSAALVRSQMEQLSWYAEQVRGKTLQVRYYPSEFETRISVYKIEPTDGSGPALYLQSDWYGHFSNHWYIETYGNAAEWIPSANETFRKSYRKNANFSGDPNLQRPHSEFLDSLSNFFLFPLSAERPTYPRVVEFNKERAARYERYPISLDDFISRALKLLVTQGENSRMVSNAFKYHLSDTNRALLAQYGIGE